jgi:asparagine synthase (glutamine-hydrolysing)
VSQDTDTFPGSRFVGVSWRPGADPAVLTRLKAMTAGWSQREGQGWLLAADRPETFAAAKGVAVALGRPGAFDRDAGAWREPPALAQDLGRLGADALRGMAAPFRAAWVDENAAAVTGETDAFGLGHVFLASGDGLAAVASSATWLADLVAAPRSPESLAGFARFGTFLGDETPFAGVTKLPAATSARLTEGRVTLTATPQPTAAAGDLVDTFRASVAATLRAVPDAELELSGGLDSRLILGAMTPAERRGRRAITLGVAGAESDDVRVAAGLAAAETLDWSVLDLGLDRFEGAALGELLAQVTAGYDHMANPLDKAALVASGRGRRFRARFGGQNGEILRGFYYAGQPLTARPSEALARRLVALRLTTNDRVDETILSPELREPLKAAAEDRVVARLMSLGGSWAETLDRYYLAQRMQNWVGIAAGNRLLDYVPLFPFFDPAFVAAAAATPAADKLNSRAAYRLLTDIDPALARIPLADGVTPAAAPTSWVGRRLNDARLDLSRINGRVRRRLAGQRRQTLGSLSVAQLWHGARLFEALPLDRLARTGLFDEAALDRVVSGAWLPDRPTLGFLLMVAGMETRA